jgi:N-methylhydantoinase A
MSAANRGAVVGVDIGGTFTDVILVTHDGRVAVAKVLSTPANYSDAIIAGIAVVVESAGLRGGDLTRVAHGTTVASNAILEASAAAPALITTAGFRDVVEIGRLRLPKLYDVAWQKPPPLVPRHLRFEVGERIGADGTVVDPLDGASLAEAIAAIRAADVRSVAVSLINAYANPIHEDAVRRQLADCLPSVDVTVATDLSRQIREVERTSTAIVNAYLRPVLRAYLDDLSSRLEIADIAAPLFVSQSTGGLTTAAEARRKPVTIVESGPAAGVVAAAALADAFGIANLISFDMGGTTAKAASIENGAFIRTADFTVGGGMITGSRLLTGAGHPLQIASIDLAEVGAGGGSIIRLDAGGGLLVGPESAGAKPGPVCYGLGGTRPTITDAAAVLGYLSPSGIAGGAIAINVGAAAAAIDQIATPLGISVEEASYAAVRIASSTMLRALRAVSSERGRDPRDHAVCVFGGNGPLFGPLLAAELGAKRVLVPPYPGIFSAVGLLFADLESEAVETFRADLATLDRLQLIAVIDRLEGLVRRDLSAAGIPGERQATERHLSLRYLGQTQTLTLVLANTSIDAAALCALAEAFGAEHERTYGHRAEAGEPLELTAVRIVGRGYFGGKRTIPEPKPSAARNDVRRRAYFGPRDGWREVRVISRGEVDDSGMAGPCIIEEYDSTCLVPPESRARLGGLGVIEIDFARVSDDGLA